MQVDAQLRVVAGFFLSGVAALFLQWREASMLRRFLAIAGSATARDGNYTPVGTWKTIDDASGKPKSLVVITESNGVLQGKIEKLFRGPEEDQNPKCDKCSGANKDQPIIGLVILTGLKYDGKTTAKSTTRTARASQPLCTRTH